MAEHSLPGRLVCCITLITFSSFNNCDTREGRPQHFAWLKAGNYLREEAVKPALRTQVVAMGLEARQEREQRGCSCASKLIYRVSNPYHNDGKLYSPARKYMAVGVSNLRASASRRGAEGLVFLRLGAASAPFLLRGCKRFS